MSFLTWIDVLITRIMATIYPMPQDTTSLPSASQPPEAIVVSNQVQTAAQASPAPSKLFQFADSIATYEGGHTPGDRAFRNNNPLDYRWPFGGALPHFATGTDSGNFLIFDTWEHGFDFGQQNIKNACLGLSEVYKPTDTIEQFFAKFAPESDGNAPLAYAQWVCKKVGINLLDPISILLT